LIQALARAVYNRRPIVILDDILKGLDADTYAKCFTAVLGPEGLLRAGTQTTIIMATHNGESNTLGHPFHTCLTRLLVQLLPHADHIVVLGEEGRIIEQGKLKDLRGDISRLGLKELSEDVTIREVDKEVSAKKSLLTKAASLREEKTTVEVTEDEQSRGRRNSDALLSYMKSMGRFKLSVFGLLALGSTGFRFAGRRSHLDS
jgi:ATP-binding cassette, subfamily C (CFTR/MRP), member 1